MSAPSGLLTMEWGECFLPLTKPPPPLAAEVRKQIGVVPAWLGRAAPCPWMARTLARFASRPVAHVPMQLYDLASLMVSQDNSCRYCYGAQRSFLKLQGFSDEYIERLERDFHLAGLTSAERLGLTFARKVSRANPRPTREDYDQLARAGLSRLAILEIAYAACAMTFANRVSTLLAFPPEDFDSMMKNPLFRLIRPLAARFMRRKLKPPERLSIPNDGPYAAVVAAFDGSPSARALRETIDSAFASSILPQRTKMLMLAVIARALGCSYSEAHARSALAGAGFAAADLEDVLANLASPKLDAHETLLVGFARETIRFQRVTPVQQRMREIAAQLTVEEALEAAGIFALANAMCRLTVVLDFC